MQPGRAYAVFRVAGYPEEVARTLIALCTNQVPGRVLHAMPPGDDAGARFALRQRLAHHHLPQGAPTSPALANLAAFVLDVRLSALADAMGARYSRYADDLVFSGDATLATAATRLERLVGSIARDEGYPLNVRKTRVMRASRRQEVTGVVVNTKPNVGRREFDRLKATLTQCVRHGLESQAKGRPEFRAHLEGRVAWVSQLSPRKGEKLAALLARVVN